MSFRPTTLRLHHLVPIFFGLVSGLVFGQAPNSPVAFANQAAITSTLVPVMALGGSDSSSGDQQWLKVEFHYSVTFPVPAAGTAGPPPNPYLPEVEFRVWIEGLDQYDPQATDPTQGVAVALTGSVKYINVLQDKDCYGVVYLHPSTLGRYSGRGGPTDFTRKFNVHVEAYIGGTLMDRIDMNKDPLDDWWTKLKPVPGLVYRQDQSPFVNYDTNRYPALKLPESK